MSSSDKAAGASSTQHCDLVCMGEPMVELNRQPDGTYLMGHGGDTCNCAIAAARLGVKTGYICRLGTDAGGDSFRKLWKEESVDVDSVIDDSDAPTALYLVDHSESGHSFTYYRKDSAASRISPLDLDEKYLAGVKVLHLSGISLAISTSAEKACRRAMDIVRDAGGWISFDTNLRLPLWPLERARESIHAAMSLSRVALPSLEDGSKLVGSEEPDAICDFYLELGAEIVGLTMGKQGTMYATANERASIAVPAIDAVDSTGAGDSFDAAFLAKLLAGDSTSNAARYATAASAASTLGYGAIAPLPRQQDVDKMLAKMDCPDS